MFLDPLGNFGKVLVLLTYIIFLAEVDQIDNRLGREKKEGIYYFDLSIFVRSARVPETKKSIVVCCESERIVSHDGPCVVC